MTNAAPICADCMHQRDDSSDGSVCVSPRSVSTPPADLIFGLPPLSPTCWFARYRQIDGCGREGRFFEPKPPASPLSSIFAWLGMVVP